jgi:hypothetical protein
MLQAAVGINPTSTTPLRKAGKSQLHRQFIQLRMAELRSRIAKGGIRECVIRGALYVGMAHGSVDERGFELIRRIRNTSGDLPRLTLADFKILVREQYFMLLIDEDAALAAIPSLLPRDTETRQRGLMILRDVLSARGDLAGEALERFTRISALFENQGSTLSRHKLVVTDSAPRDLQSAAS